MRSITHLCIRHTFTFLSFPVFLDWCKASKPLAYSARCGIWGCCGVHLERVYSEFVNRERTSVLHGVTTYLIERPMFPIHHVVWVAHRIKRGSYGVRIAVANGDNHGQGWNISMGIALKGCPTRRYERLPLFGIHPLTVCYVNHVTETDYDEPHSRRHEHRSPTHLCVFLKHRIGAHTAAAPRTLIQTVAF